MADSQQAEDLVSVTVLRALERAETFRGDSSLRTWLHKILHNLAVDQARATREHADEAAVAAVTAKWKSDGYTVDADEVILRLESREELFDALIRLPYIYRAAVVLHDAEGMTMRQIADIFDVSLPAAKQRLRRARMMLVTSLAHGAERRTSLAGVPLKCWDARRLVSDYLDDDLPVTDRHAIEAHLEGCPTCPALYRSLVASTEALANTSLPSRDPDSTIPPALEAKIRAGHSA
ncbi:MAG: sigma-70 family RNA polymerase sigma factor [Actinobacteria bacterium]|nr:sigma-70 family RNA polymerase sigma factor [Actinomycetota bacterium]